MTDDNDTFQSPTPPDTSRFIGMTLAQVKQEISWVRVYQAGKVRMVLTRDFRPDRLNVKLSEDSLSFKEETRIHNGVEYKYIVVDGSMDNGVIVEAHFG
jgi:hypothetical protein